jgi:PAS domain S-box-containing protein
LRRSFAAQTTATALVHEQKELFRVTLASIGDGVITTDVTARVTSLNAVAQDLTGWTQDDAAGQPLEAVFRIVNQQTRQTVENPAARALREGIIVGLANHTLLIRRDGKEMSIDDSGAPIRDAEGRALGAVLVFREVNYRPTAVPVAEAAARAGALPTAAATTFPPAAATAFPRQTPKPRSPPDAAATAALTILIADDNPDSVESLGILLRANGYQVHLAHDGREAVESATRLKPDVIILDIGMPKLNGYDAAKRMREQDWAATVLFIAITGWGQAQDRQRSMDAGFNHHLIKPVDAEELEQLLQTYAAGRSRPTV